MNTVYGIIIYLNKDTHEENPYFGLLYDRIYWAEYPLINLGSPYDIYNLNNHDYTIAWRADFIAKNGIGSIPKSVNLDKGGDTSNIGTCQIRVKNTNNFVAYLKALDTSLTGCNVEIIEFCGTDEKSDSISATKIFTGVIEDGVDGDETTCSLTISTSLTRKRKANMAHLIENGGENGSTDIIPITFGESNPNEKRYFIAKKTRFEEKKYSIKELLEMAGFSGLYGVKPEKLNRFPVGYSSDNKIRLRIGHVADIDVGWGNPVPALKNVLIDKYLFCPEGNTENVGKYRKIIDITNYHLDTFNELHPEQSSFNTAWLEIETEYFPVPPSGNWNANAENQSWFEIININAEYQIESEFSGGFYDSENDKLSNEVELYYTEDKQTKKTKISDVSIENDNKINIKLRGYNNGTGKINSYGIVPITDIAPSTHTNWLVTWDGVGMDDFIKTADGVWVTDENMGTEHESSSITGQGRHCDRNIDLSWRFVNVFNNYPKYCVCVTFKLPQIDDNFKFSKAYLMLRFTSTITNLIVPGTHHPPTWFSVKTRRWFGGVKHIENTNQNEWDHISIYNFPDSYTGKKTKNRYFDQTLKGSEWTGYNLFDLSVTNKAEYDAIYEGIILVVRNSIEMVSEYQEDFRIYEIGVAFETEADISNDVYVNFKGRIINNIISKLENQNISVTTTPGNRIVLNITSINGHAIGKGSKIRFNYTCDLNKTFKCYAFDSENWVIGGSIFENNGESEFNSVEFELTQENVAGITLITTINDTFNINYSIYLLSDFNTVLIDNPISIIDHCLRYQNWNEKGIEQDWGHYYNNDSEIIKTNGEGSFNASYLDEVKNKKCAFQILDYSKAWTDSIIRLICNEFYLIHYQDGNGKECLDYMFRSEPECQLVTYGDTKGQIGALERPKARDVNCKPVIKYAFDQYSGEYRKELRIKNISESTYNETFVSGFNGSDGQTVWNQCRELYNIVGSIDDNNEGDIELNAIYRYEDAVWHLQRRIWLMKKCMLQFSVPYTIGKTWRVGTHIRLQLPHETNNEIKECIIKEVTFNKSNDIVSVVVLIDDNSVTPPEVELIQETIGQDADLLQESIGGGEETQETINE